MSDRGLHDPFELFASTDSGVSHEPSWNHTQFDAMLEILPENLNLDVGGLQQDTSSPVATTLKFESNTTTTTITNASMKDDGSPDVIGEEDDEGGWKTPVAEISSHNGLKSRPIDIVQSVTPSTTAGQLIGNDLNLQNGEIAQLWDFNVHEFMMTPSDHSDSATISAPSSFNSEQFTPGTTTPGFNPASSTASITNNNYNNGNNNGNNNNNNNTNSNSHFQNSWNHLLHQQHDNGPNSSSLAYQHPRLFQNNNSSQSTIKADEYQHKQPQLPRRSSSRNLLIKNDMNEDGALPLLTHTTTNLVKKNSSVKNLPTTTLPQYRRCSSSTNMQVMNGPPVNNGAKANKPPTQCYNCKTLKTPLWRRDPDGNTLCNACGLFQKLHGTMRPLSLKSDIIKKRNTKKRTKKDDKPASNMELQGQNDHSTNRGSQSPEKFQRKLSAKHTSIQPAANIYNQSALSQNSLNNLNKKTATKSRRSSTSSSTSSKSSSSRSVVPILPKPSPGSRENTLQQFQYQIQMQVSQPNSAASSPRYSNSPRFYPTSPSTGLGVSIPRRKSSRTQISQSSSFMAQSLQQLQHQQHNSSSNHTSAGISTNGSNSQASTATSQNANNLSSSTNSSSNATISAPNSWANHSLSQPQNIASPNSSRSPFELFSNPNSQPKKSHKSLLSQQLQNSSNSSSSSSSFVENASSGQQLSQTPPSHHSQTQQNFGSSVPAASPRSSYVDTLQQQRGILQYEQQQVARRKTPSTRQSNPSLFESSGSSLSKPKKENNVMDDLDWLKFGM
ncbi:nitrogen-responsive transcriptional regulator GLN3 [Kluyveromyces lactis]|uniref:KLLA0A01342p n=1 Tax=Kluyveromyces lactis (strain ATCC 8585 / CBS 2359 / DSM 70799 / NBRC 1267 / NRRL Y-1140 / WM37) TaxID=284590 RepID=Q6CYD1_KLULA|nr:uncharacterized protein KLLA0_A01342g [Kluyveromyces lactis]CAH02646.1 KLLA0A01342p [Kluyveromyces lactis]|eukprot:XP_451058.1 uncharacterized protein KLLA0_A01342g [Kluyveromyces lactis]